MTLIRKERGENRSRNALPVHAHCMKLDPSPVIHRELLNGMDKLKTLESDYQSETQGIEKKQGAIIAHDNITELQNGECQLVGPEYSLIPEGEYQAIYLYHETSNIFTRKEGKAKTGGKLYLWFEILPFHSGEINEKRLFKSYNVTSLVGKKGRGGKFRMTRGKWFVREARVPA